MSWNANITRKQVSRKCQPLREAVSWNFLKVHSEQVQGSQPLREAVSWNKKAGICIVLGSVSLFVRLWVEIPPFQRQKRKEVPSASSWGCELKCYDTVVRYLRNPVSLFVRLWVEMLWYRRSLSSEPCQPLREAVSWNANNVLSVIYQCSQPLREAVSWNASKPISLSAPANVSLFVRLWVEIIMYFQTFIPKLRQPLREAVSWNIFCRHGIKTGTGSASSWGCELKYPAVIQ